MFFGRPVGRAEAEHLHLVELVHPEDAPGVFAGSPGFAPEATRVAHVAQRQFRLVQDLVHVQRGQRYLRRPHQVEAVRLHPVDLLHVGGEEARAVHGLVAHQHRHHHGPEALGRQLLQRELHQCELQEHQVALEIGEAATRGAGAALHIDEIVRRRQIEMIERREGEFPGGAPLVQHHRVLFASLRGGGIGQVGDLEQFLFE